MIRSTSTTSPLFKTGCMELPVLLTLCPQKHTNTKAIKQTRRICHAHPKNVLTLSFRTFGRFRCIRSLLCFPPYRKGRIKLRPVRFLYLRFFIDILPYYRRKETKYDLYLSPVVLTILLTLLLLLSFLHVLSGNSALLFLLYLYGQPQPFLRLVSGAAMSFLRRFRWSFYVL